jgi:hypothetical protein
VFDGLLPEPHNSDILRLLFVCAHWHGLAKLRMHTDHTLDILDETTVRIGAEFRAFVRKTCPAFDTRELNREVEARQRRKKKQAQKQAQSKDTASSRSVAVDGSNAKRPRKKKFSLQTYKYHSVGDYANTIRRFGTTDSYSTEPVSVFGYLRFVMVMNSYRVSLSTVHQRLDTSARTKICLLNS